MVKSGGLINTVYPNNGLNSSGATKYGTNSAGAGDGLKEQASSSTTATKTGDLASSKQGKKDSIGSVRACYACNEQGHYAFECPKISPEQRKLHLEKKLRLTRAAVDRAKVQNINVILSESLYNNDSEEAERRDNDEDIDLEHLLDEELLQLELGQDLGDFQDMNISNMCMISVGEYDIPAEDLIKKTNMGPAKNVPKINDLHCMYNDNKFNEEFSMPLSLNNHICICAVDTQAEVSMIDSKSTLLIPELIEPIEGYFRTAMGHLVPKSGVFEMEIDYDGVKWYHKFQIGNIFDPIKFNFQIIVGKDLLRRMGISLTQVCFPRSSRNSKSECDAEKVNRMDVIQDSEMETQMVANRINDLLKINEALPWGAKIEPVKLKLKSGVDFDKMNKKNYGESYPLRPLVDEAILKWEKSTIVSEMIKVSPVNHPLVIVPKIPVPKEANDIRICLDFREFNMSLADDSIDNFKLPEIFRSLQDRFGGMKIFSEIDLTNAFNQIPLHDDSKFLTCFTHNRKQFCFKEDSPSSL